MRRCAAGFGGETNISTPAMDRLAGESLDFTNAISGTPVCCPARASLMTGRYAHHHGVLINDIHLDDTIPSLGRSFANAGYSTGYVGKWHLNANGRKEPVPPASQHGFQLWKALECTHDYNASDYYEGTNTEMKRWPGYDAFAQTDEAIGFVEANANRDRPFMFVLSWGPPHDPYETAPEEFRRCIKAEEVRLRPNVPPEKQAIARQELAGYYAHILALDHALGRLLDAVDRAGVAEDTIFVFWSDHGDMLHSHGEPRKQRPWEESVHVPLLIRYPRRFSRAGQRVEAPINTPDLMPTLLGLCGLPIPAGVDGTDYSAYLEGKAEAPATAALLACYAPFGEYVRNQGGREYRGVRTTRYTYVESLAGPWILYDDRADPFQMCNLVDDPAFAEIRRDLQQQMHSLLAKTGDDFEPAENYNRRFNYVVDETGTASNRDFA